MSRVIGTSIWLASQTEEKLCSKHSGSVMNIFSGVFGELFQRDVQGTTQRPFDFSWYVTHRARPYDVGFLHANWLVALSNGFE